MKHDLIIVGGGPAGLTAARIAAEDGLKVLLIERKKVIPHIERQCAQFAPISFSVLGEPIKKYGYLEPISLEISTDKTRVHFPGPGFSIDYSGPLRPYLRWICISPSGYQIRREKEDRFFGYNWSKEVLLAGILSEAEKAGAEILTETMVLGAENTSDGVKVSMRTTSGEKTLEARKAIAADGWGSKMVDSLGLNKDRPTTGSHKMRGYGLVLEGVETELRHNSWLQFTIPSLNPAGSISMVMMPGDTNRLGTAELGDISPVEALEKFMKMPAFASWFHNVRVVAKVATAGDAEHVRRPPLMEPAAGNVLIASDATGIEATNPGAIACGYQAAKATLKELSGQKGYQEYTDWYLQSFENLLPNFKKAAARFMSLNPVCTNDDVDYLYDMLQGQAGLPPVLAAQNLERISKERPELYKKLKQTGIDKTLDGQELDAADVFGK
jgi:flavin-dependent dehydrogenase